MYLNLFHGRHSADEELTGWGFAGPCIGPLTGYPTTYASQVRFRFGNAPDR